MLSVVQRDQDRTGGDARSAVLNQLGILGKGQGYQKEDVKSVLHVIEKFFSASVPVVPRLYYVGSFRARMSCSTNAGRSTISL